MAHYAFLDENNIVTEIIVGIDEGVDNIDWEQHYGNFRGQVCKRTSYNTVKNTHVFGGTPFRGNYAGIGYTYDEQMDAFIPPKPYESWLLNKETFTWISPIPQPDDGNIYDWDEEEYRNINNGWVLVE
jgi:hypothetical protein